MSREMIFELGTEEIPAGMVKDLRENLAGDAREKLKERRIDFAGVNTYSTPRRLVLQVEGIAEMQSDKKEVVRGPSEEIAFDDEGSPTKAARGFARGQGVELDEIEIRDGYLYVDKLIEGSPTGEVLPELLPELIRNLEQPQTMRWGDKSFEFVRPIRWMMALLDDEVVDFEMAGIKSGRRSRGHRFLGKDQFSIEAAGEYFQALERECVIVDQENRRQMILEQLKELETEERKPLIREELLEEVTNLVEYPTAFKGEFSSRFLSVPDEVLITSMIEHQRYFPVEEGEELAPYFIGVRNGNEEHIDNVIKGNEMVIRARLADAAFFYEEDRSVSPQAFNEDLKDIVYQEELGSLFDKVKRLEDLAEDLAESLDFSGEQKEKLVRAARLSKFDLATDMVEEFAKLQGVMGRIYALDAGEDEEVARALEEHYLPAGSGDELPESDIAALLSLVDKIDDIVSNFYVGNRPSGSHDPFALRRKGLGIIRILLDRDWQLSLDNMIESTAELIEAGNETVSEVKGFLGDRLNSHLTQREIRYDVISAVMASGFDDLPDCWQRCQAVMELREMNLDKFEALIHGLQRCQNLAEQGSPAGSIESDLFVEAEEKDLYRQYGEILGRVEENFQNHNYLPALEAIVSLKDPIDSFLDNVVVMVDEEDVRKNRLKLLQEVSTLIEPVMDIADIALDEQ